MLDAVSIRSPFLTPEQVGFFLQQSLERVRLAYKTGKLPLARRADGGPFEPSRNGRLIPYEELHPLLGEEAQALLDLWELGRFEVPERTSKFGPPPTFAEALASLTTSEGVTDE